MQIPLPRLTGTGIQYQCYMTLSLLCLFFSPMTKILLDIKTETETRLKFDKMPNSRLNTQSLVLHTMIVYLF